MARAKSGKEFENCGTLCVTKSRQVRTGISPKAWLAVVIVGLLLAAATLAAYWRVFGCEFLVEWDDPHYVTGNPNVRGGLTPRSIAWAFTTMYFANWHPLTWLSHMLDCRVYGLDPMGHHLTNLLFHIANALLLFWVLTRMTGSIWRSGFVAALFAVHPLHVESVAWVAERKDVLSTFFWLLTVWAYVGYAERPRFRRYILVLLAFALGLMAKPMLVSLPIILLVLDWWPLYRLAPKGGLHAWKPLVSEKIPLFALSAISCIVTFMAQRGGGATGMLGDCPFGARAANAVLAYAEYIAKTVWPGDLACLYPYAKSPPTWRVAAAGLFLMGMSALAIEVRRRGRDYRYLAAGWLWYLVTLVPVIGLVQVGAQSMADRYTYIPLIGVFVMAAWGIPDLVDRAVPCRGVAASSALAASAGLVILALGVCARVQVGYWRNSVVLFEHALDVTRDNYVMHDHLGRVLSEQGKYETALMHHVKALRINPDYADGHYELGNFLARRGRHEEAIAHYTEALGICPGSAQVHNNLGLALYQLGKYDDAAGHYSEALRINPKHPQAHNNLGTVLYQQGKLDEAAREFSEAIRLRPDSAKAHFNLAAVLYRKGEYAGAWAEVRLCRKYGSSPPPDFLQALSEKMPEPE